MAISVAFASEEENRLAELARRAGMTSAQLVQGTIENCLEDIEDWVEAEETMRRVRSGEMRTYSLDEAEARLGLVG